MDTFRRLAPYIQDYIYKNGWTELREIQVAACDIIFNTDNNLLLSSGTASGKTEAAFLPVLTLLEENPSHSVGVLYVSPLKALINDQFMRLDHLLAESKQPVCKWHGDASVSAKNRLLKNPRGVLQITPESLESMLINRREGCIGLFKDLRYIIIDEVHYFMSSPRGTQLLCILERIQRLAGCDPRRIGLSATLGNYESAEAWLNTGSTRACSTPRVSGGKKKLSLYMQRFVVNKAYDEESGADADSSADAENNKKGDEETENGYEKYYEFLYKQTLGKKAIIFAKSRAEVELAIAKIKQIAQSRKTPDIYRVHHGSISALLREEAEADMKMSDLPIVTGATVTLELGMDIGALDRVIQLSSPLSASSFTQRIGRCGRKGQPAELLFTFIDEEFDITTDAMRSMNWEFLKTIAIIQLYLEEKWVEPVSPSRHPYALLYHQTMSFLLSSGEVSAATLAHNVLGLSAFSSISQDDYRMLLRHLIDIGQIQLTERSGLIVGHKAERLTSSFDFYSVFEAPVEYLVKEENQSIGTIMQVYPVGTRFVLAGRTWETVSINEKSRILFAKEVKGLSRINWPTVGDTDIHTKVVRKMRDVLISDESFAYLSESCSEKLSKMREVTRTAGFATNTVTSLSESKYAIFPWIGTRQLTTLYFALQKTGVRCSIQPGGFTQLFIEAYFPDGKKALENLLNRIYSTKIDKYSFDLPHNIQIPTKYNNFIQPELLRKEYIEDYLDDEGLGEK